MQCRRLFLLVSVLVLVPATAWSQDGVAGLYLMQYDGVTIMNLQENGRFIYEDPINSYEGAYSVTDDSVVLDFSGLGWYRAEALACKRSGSGLSCDDRALYQPWQPSFDERIHGKYYDTNDNSDSISLQRDKMFIYNCDTGIFESRYTVEGDKVTLNFVDGAPFGENFTICLLGPGTLDCNNGVLYRREH